YLAAQSAAGGAESPEDGSRRFPLVFLGAAAGLSIWGFSLAQIMGPYYCGVTAAGLGLAIAMARSWHAPHADTSHSELTSSRSTLAPDIPASQPVCELPAIVQVPVAAAIAFSLGGFPIALASLLEQLMPGTVYVA